MRREIYDEIYYAIDVYFHADDGCCTGMVG